jgi:hypothetical protein
MKLFDLSCCSIASLLQDVMSILATFCNALVLMHLHMLGIVTLIMSKSLHR